MAGLLEQPRKQFLKSGIRMPPNDGRTTQNKRSHESIWVEYSSKCTVRIVVDAAGEPKAAEGSAKLETRNYTLMLCGLVGPQLTLALMGKVFNVKTPHLERFLFLLSQFIRSHASLLVN